MSVTANWLKTRNAITGLDYTPIAQQLEIADQVRNPNDLSANQRFLQTLFDTTAQHEAGKQLPIKFKAPRR
jgi:hypothetical protein